MIHPPPHPNTMKRPGTTSAFQVGNHNSQGLPTLHSVLPLSAHEDDPLTCK